MNIIDIIICLILGLCVVAGMYKGFLSSGLSIFAFAGSWFASFKLYKRVTDFIAGNTAIMESLRSVLDAEEMFQTGSLAAMKVADLSDVQINQAASEINIPLIGDMFRNNLVNRVFANTDISTVTDYLTETLLVSFLNVFSFLLVFVAVYFVATLVVNLLNNVFRFPQLKHLDWLLGGLLGAVRGVAILLLIFAVLPAALSTLESMGLKNIQEIMDGAQLAKYLGWSRDPALQQNLLSSFIGTIMK